MRKLITLFAVLGMVLALAPAAQAGLVISVQEHGGKVYFAWNGIIGNSGTGVAATTRPSADQIVPNTGNVQQADRTHTNVVAGKWNAVRAYAGATSVYGSGESESDFLVACNIPFFVKGADGSLIVGYFNQDDTGDPDLSTQVFTGSFSLPGTFASLGLFTTGFALPTTLWTAASGGGSIVFEATPPAGPVFLLK
jgi:hypothetical protein